jgi:hypothetical protein
MSKLKNNFTETELKSCCIGFCKNCKIANAYKEKYGKKKGKRKLKKDKIKIKE